MDAEFNDFIGFVIDHEGREWENDPNDRGNIGDGVTPGNVGTKFGIDAASHPGVDILNLTEPVARQLYWEEWTRDRVEQIPHPADLVYFDDSVNAGEEDATRILQASLNELLGPALIVSIIGCTLAVDGKLGPLTLQVAARARGTALAVRMLGKRDAHYQAIAQTNPREAEYLNGWLNRVADLQHWITNLPVA
jgi:lysozyme family protein